MAKRNVQVEVMEAIDQGEKMITVTIMGASEDFLFADLLAQRRAIPSCSALLKTAALDVIRGYLISAETVVSGVKSDSKPEAPTTQEESPKRSRKSQVEPQKEKTGLANLSAKAVNGEATIAAPSGD